MRIGSIARVTSHGCAARFMQTDWQTGEMSTMDQAQLLQAWTLLTAIIVRQSPFAQIMIVVGTAFFAVMAIEGIRTSILAMRRGHSQPRALAIPDSPPPAAVVSDVPVARLSTTRSIPRPVTRSAKKMRAAAFAPEKRLTPAYRQASRMSSRDDPPKTTSF